MGCFLACFGISKKRKRRRLSNRVSVAVAGDYRRGSYVPLDSSSFAIVGVKERRISASSQQLRDKPKEGKKSQKIRKKVSFNLNVQTYEPVSNDYVESEKEQEEEVDNNGEEVLKGSRSSTSASNRALAALTSSVGLFPSNYRYRNVRDSYDSYEEEEYLADEESDFDDDDDDYYGDDDYCDGDSDMEDPRISQEGFPNKQSFSSSVNGESESCRWNLNAGVNIPSAHSVLSPIENLSQWKAAKAKVAAAPKQQKENVPSFQEPRFIYSRSSCKPLLPEIPVHSTLAFRVGLGKSECNGQRVL